MEEGRFKKTYAVINLIFVIILSTLFFTPFFIINQIYILNVVNIVIRIVFGVFCIFTGIWNGFTPYYSFLKLKSNDKSDNASTWSWIAIIILGIGCVLAGVIY